MSNILNLFKMSNILNLFEMSIVQHFESILFLIALNESNESEIRWMKAGEKW